MRFKRNTLIGCNAADRMDSHTACTDARLLSNGFLAVLYEYYRRAQERTCRASETTGERNTGEG
jgi:hypothetical protein